MLADPHDSLERTDSTDSVKEDIRPALPSPLQLDTALAGCMPGNCDELPGGDAGSALTCHAMLSAVLQGGANQLVNLLQFVWQQEQGGVDLVDSVIGQDRLLQSFLEESARVLSVSRSGLVTWLQQLYAGL